MGKVEILKRAGSLLALAALSTLITACGGGGDGGGGGGVISYPNNSVYGDVCATFEATPGCTFNRRSGTRINVSQDPDYNRFGFESDDLWFVKFDQNGNAEIFDDNAVYQYTTDVTQFEGFVFGTIIGVGAPGLVWENVANGTYWLGKNYVLYSANSSNHNFGEAINNKDAKDASDSSFAALNAEDNKALVKAASSKLQKEYGFSVVKATAVASALNIWAVAGAERGYTTTGDMDKTFKTVFGVDYRSALSAVKDLQAGDKVGMKDLTDRSAAALGLKPAQAQKFIKGMYKKALAEWGFDVESMSW